MKFNLGRFTFLCNMGISERFNFTPISIVETSYSALVEVDGVIQPQPILFSKGINIAISLFMVEIFFRIEKLSDEARQLIGNKDKQNER